MERWLLKRGPPAKDPEVSVEKKKPESQKSRQFHDEYIGMGFTCTSQDPPLAQWFLCGELPANSAMKPSHLQRHLRTKHQPYAGNTMDFFRRKLTEFRSSQEKMQKATTASIKLPEASYAVSRNHLA